MVLKLPALPNCSRCGNNLCPLQFSESKLCYMELKIARSLISEGRRVQHCMGIGNASFLVRSDVGDLV